MNKVFSAFAVLFLIAGTCYDLCARTVTIRISCRAKGCEKELCENAVKEWVKSSKKKYKDKIKVEIVTLPHASNECFALYQQWLSAGSFDIDILQMDVAWVGAFSDYLEPLNHYYRGDEIDISDYFDAVAHSMYDGDNLIALPWYADCGIMFYRKDLLEKHGKEVPETWEELYDTAYYIQNIERKMVNVGEKFYGFIFQAKAFEMLTCNFVEFVDSFGGKIVDEDRIVVNSKACIKAVKFMIKCMKNINCKGALNYSEEDSRGVFQSGNALFMRSWPYAWALMNEKSTAVAGKIGVMAIPPSASGGKSTGVLGGWFLAVSKYSKNKEVAADLVKFLTSKDQQKKRAKYSYLPASKSLYTDEEVLKDNPFFKDLFEPLSNAVTRPSIDFGRSYPRASSEIYNSINVILTEAVEEGRTSERYIVKSLNRLFERLNGILKRKLRLERKKRGPGMFTWIKNWVSSFWTPDNPD